MKDQKDKAAARVVRALHEEFARRQAERRYLEKGWELNMQFLAGNQYCGIAPDGELEEEEARFAWQYRRVFNHIAPAIDTRCAKLSRVRPVMTVRAGGGSEEEMRAANVASNVLRSACEECGFNEVVSRATVWSETCGTAFYKVLWEEGVPGRQAGVRVVAVPPFEVYPQALGCESVEEQESIIHAKAMPVSDIERLYGVRPAGRDISEFSLAPVSAPSNFAGGQGGAVRGVLKDAELVIELYRRPTADLPDGRLTVVAGEFLVYDGPLPYRNGENGERTYPFVKQCAIELSGAFFGGSVIDRMIPVQRAYNAVKNRKHEFLNRLTMGVLAVEDGSVDADELLEEGLAPGRVIVYRQGSTPPKMLGADSLPAEFAEEEAMLLNEFVLVSGVSEISTTSQNRTNVSSAVGLQLLIDQDDTRLAVTTDSIKRAMKKVGRHILRLMRQCAGKRVMRAAGTGQRVETFSFCGADIASDDVVFRTDNDETNSPSKRRSLIYELYNMGLLADENGKVSDETRARVLDALGFAGLDGGQGIGSLHANKAAGENMRLLTEDVPVDFYDDDALHVDEHTRFLLSGEFRGGDEAKARFEEHLRAHRVRMREQGNAAAAESRSA